MTADATSSTHVPRTLDHPTWMAIAAEEYSRLGDLLGSIPDSMWDAPTDCEGWSVHDVVAHLIGAADTNASLREAARQAWSARDIEAPGDLIDRVNAVQVLERRGLSPGRLRADLRVAAPRGLAGRRRVPGWLRALPVPFGPPLGTRTLGYLLGRVYTRDAWMHRVDLARATGASLVLTAEHDGRLVEDVVAEWARAHGRPYVLDLEGPAGGHWERRGTPGQHSEQHRIDAVEFARTLSGRRAGSGLLSLGVPF